MNIADIKNTEDLVEKMMFIFSDDFTTNLTSEQDDRVRDHFRRTLSAVGAHIQTLEYDNKRLEREMENAEEERDEAKSELEDMAEEKHEERLVDDMKRECVNENFHRFTQDQFEKFLESLPGC